MLIRNFRWADLVEVVKVINRAERAKGFAGENQVEVIQYQLERYFEAERDCFVAASSAGKIIGIGTMRFEHPDGTGLGVHDILPEVSQKEVGPQLIQATDERLRAKWSGRLPLGGQIKVERDIYDFEEEKKAVLAAAGYQQVGNTHYMVLKLDKQLEKPIMPNEIEFRRFAPENARALYELFQDVFGAELGRSYANWRDHYHLDETFFDPTWWPVAWQGDKIVGVSVCYADMHEEPRQTVWIDNLGVRADFRRKGVGGGLLQQSLVNFQERGYVQAIARPDGNHPFVSVLVSMGFTIEKTRLWYEKVLLGENV